MLSDAGEGSNKCPLIWLHRGLKEQVSGLWSGGIEAMGWVNCLRAK